MQFTNILLPVDGSNYSDHATEYALYLARQCGARITAVSCYEWLGHMPDVNGSLIEELKDKIARQAAEVLNQTSRILTKAGIEHDTEILSGEPGKMLTSLAKSKRFDLIVMGSHGHSDIAGLFLGSVTHKVLNKIYCPVLVVP
ncbi:MAG: universal stress protein [Desulfocapsaceae bacterium]|jgi:nucleotide-binding universal stress UspA family protein|nr:universal stress protein [Desulfocapsaceae bacterium]